MHCILRILYISYHCCYLAKTLARMLNVLGQRSPTTRPWTNTGAWVIWYWVFRKTEKKYFIDSGSV